MFERFTVQARAAVVRAQLEANQLLHPHIGTEHLLLALLAAESGIPYAVLSDAGVEAAEVREDIERLVGPSPKILSDEDAAALRAIGIDLDTVLARIGDSVDPAARLPPCSMLRRGLLRRRRAPRAGFTPRAKKVLGLALREALRLQHNYIGSEHILLGLLRESDGLAAEILDRRGVNPDRLRLGILMRLDKAA